MALQRSAGRHLSIRWKIVLPFLILAIVVGAILLPLTGALVERRVETEADRRLGEVADSVGRLIENSRQQAELSASFVANQPEVYAALNAPDSLAASLNTQKEHLGLQELSLYAPNFQSGDTAVYYGGPPVTRRFQVSEHTQQIRDNLILQVLRTGDSAAAIAIAPQSSQIIGAAPIFAPMGEAGSHEPGGVILAAFFMDEDYAAEISDIIGADIGLVSNNAVIISTIDQASGYEDLLKHGFGADASLAARNIKYGDGASYRLLAAPLTLGGERQGTTLVALPINELFQVSQSIQAILILFAAIFALTSLGLGIAVVLSFVRPLTRLAEASTEMSRGNLDQQVPVSYFLYQDEVTDLSLSFNSMAERLKDLYENLERKVEERTAELVEERNKLNEALRELGIARDLAVAANQAKSEFISVVSHELKVPMTSIKGYSDLLLAGMAGPISEQQKEFLKTVRSNVLRMATLVSDLADVSRIETGHLRLEPSVVSVAEVVEEVARLAQAQIDAKEQTLIADIPPDLPQVWCDRNRLGQVMTNLVSNANKYTPEGGAITVAAQTLELRRDDSDERRLTVLVQVQDTGYGIKQEDQQRLFQKFFRADDSQVREASGTGLGLNITKSLIELQGGAICVESEYRKGTTFYFTLPIHDGNGQQ